MDSIHITEVKVQLTLTQEEAQWLNEAMRNPISGLPADDENNLDYEMRKKFFAATIIK